MLRSMWIVVVASLLLGGSLLGQEVRSKEFGFSVQIPQSRLEGYFQWSCWRAQSLVHLDRRECARAKNLSFMSLPIGKDAATGKAGSTLDDVKEGIERGFLKKADKKVSSEEITLAGHKAYRVVALKKLPTGEDRHLVMVVIVANGRTNSIAGMTRIPWDQDEELARFMQSLQFDK